MIPIGFRCLPSVLAHIEDASFDADPVHVTGQLLGNIRLAASGQANHSDDMRNVDIGCRTVTWNGERTIEQRADRKVAIAARKSQKIPKR